MRKWNTILSVLMLLIFMIHGIMGSFMLNGVGSSAGKLLAWIGVGILVVHGCEPFLQIGYVRTPERPLSPQARWLTDRFGEMLQGYELQL